MVSGVGSDFEMEFSFSGKGPGGNEFCSNLAKMEAEYAILHRRDNGKENREKYSFFSFSIGEAGREIFNTWIWPKIVDDKGEPTDEDEITVAALFKKFEDYCKPKRNLIVERHKFNTRRQNPGESIDHYFTDLKTLAASCEYGSLVNDLITSQ